MIRASMPVWASMLVLTVAGASPALAGAARDCVARAATDRTGCPANSAKAASVDPARLGSAIVAMQGIGDFEASANSRLTQDSIEPSHGIAAATAFMRALESRPPSVGSRIKRLRAGAATAGGNAMSGSVFRGDTRFNLTAKVASEGGGRAGAIEMGTQFAQRLALNAGVTKGFNKVRETVGRLGITLGW